MNNRLKIVYRILVVNEKVKKYIIKMNEKGIFICKPVWLFQHKGFYPSTQKHTYVYAYYIFVNVYYESNYFLWYRSLR